MNIKTLKLTNFLSYADQEFNLGQLSGPILIVGRYADGQVGESNGSGKSTIFAAQAWCLFGEGRGKSDDELIRTGEEKMSVTEVFQIDGVEYEVVRTRKRKKSQTLKLTDITNDVKLTGNSVRETEAKIVSVLGMNYNVFSNTVYSPQDKLALFPSQTSAGRKDILSSILGLDLYAEMEDKAKRLASNYERDALALQMNIVRMETELGQDIVTDDQVAAVEKDVAALQAEVDRFNSDRTIMEKQAEDLRSRAVWHQKITQDLQKCRDDIVRIDGQRSFIEDQRTRDLTRVDTEVESFRVTAEKEKQVCGAVAEIDEKIRSYEQISKSLTDLKEKRITAQVERDSLRREMESKDKDLDKLRKKLAQVEGGEIGSRCPVCYSSLTPEHQAKISQDIINEGTELRKVYDETEAKFKGFDTEFKRIDFEVKKIGGEVEVQGELNRDRDRLQKELLDIEMARVQLNTVDDRKKSINELCDKQNADLNAEKKKSEEQIVTLDSELKKAAYDEGALGKINQSISELGVSISQRMQERGDKDQILGGLRARKEAYDRKADQLKSDKARHKEAKEQEFIYKELVLAFGKKGIPALIMDNALAEIQIEVNRIMDQLTGGKIKVEFQTQRETKKKTTVETLDIDVSDSLGTRDFNLYSGGEKARVALAIRLGLSKVISRRAGKKIEWIGIDEVSALDPAGLAAFGAMIQEISKDYKQVFVVSHLPELKNQFPNTLEIVKARDGSHLELESVASVNGGSHV